MQILKGHTSQETAYLVDDYPYGFRLRCKIRYWLEFKPKHGYRFVSQTTNPKLSFERWNTPKAGTYHFFACMYLNEENHVTYSALSHYATASECKAWSNQYGEGLPEADQNRLSKWIEAKQAYEAKHNTNG